MAWTTPLTAVLNATLTAVQWNASVRDNLLASEAGIATGVGNYFAATAANTLAIRRIQSIYTTATESTTSTSYTDLTTVGPSATCTTGATAIVWISAEIDTSTTNALSKMSYAVSGATVVAASDDWGTWIDGQYDHSPTHRGACHRHTGLTPGSNVFTMKYAVGSATGSYGKRQITVLPF